MKYGTVIMLFLVFVIQSAQIKGEYFNVEKDIESYSHVNVYISPLKIDKVGKKILYYKLLENTYENRNMMRNFTSIETIENYCITITEHYIGSPFSIKIKSIYTNDVHPVLGKYSFLKLPSNSSIIDITCNISGFKGDNTENHYYVLKHPSGYLPMKGWLFDVIYYDWDISENHFFEFVNVYWFSVNWTNPFPI